MPAKSKAQQRLFGMAYAAKKDGKSSKQLSPEVARLKSMLSKSKLREFAKTKSKDLPEHKEDSKKTAASYKEIPAESLYTIPNTKTLNLKQFKLNKNMLPQNNQRIPLSQKIAMVKQTSTKVPYSRLPLSKKIASIKQNSETVKHTTFNKKAGLFDKLGLNMLKKSLRRSIVKHTKNSEAASVANAFRNNTTLKALVKNPRIAGRMTRTAINKHPLVSSTLAAGGMLYGGKNIYDSVNAPNAYKAYENAVNAETAKKYPFKQVEPSFMDKAIGTVEDKYLKAKDWLNVPENREKLYKALAAAGVLGTAGYLGTSLLTSGMDDDSSAKSFLKNVGTIAGLGLGAYGAYKGYGDEAWNYLKNLGSTPASTPAPTAPAV